MESKFVAGLPLAFGVDTAKSVTIRTVNPVLLMSSGNGWKVDGCVKLATSL